MFKVIGHNLFLCVHVTQALFTLNTKPHEAYCDWYDHICTCTFVRTTLDNANSISLELNTF